MGHPGAPDHDHHRSIWFAHQKVQGVDFWSDRTPARIRQKQWLAYQDGDEAIMAVLLGWNDGHDPKDLLEQELIVSVRPGLVVELQSTFRPTAESLEFGKTNFGFLAVRVAKSISAFFGGGQITGASGAQGEPKLFGKPNAWMDYSGPVTEKATEGVTYYDHPSNPDDWTPWHVREDGWMGAATCLIGPVSTTRKKPLVLRYLLHAHAGEYQPATATKFAKTFAALTPFELVKSPGKHQQFAVRRAASQASEDGA
jgi:hypothetical protein